MCVEPSHDRWLKRRDPDRVALRLLAACGAAGALAACTGPAQTAPTAVALFSHPTPSPIPRPQPTAVPLIVPRLSPTPSPAEAAGSSGFKPTSTPGLARVLLESQGCPQPFDPAPLWSAARLPVEIARQYEQILLDYLNAGGTAGGIPDHLAAFPTEHIGYSGPSINYLRSVDLTGDGDSEILVSLDWNSQAGGLYIFRREGDLHQTLLSFPTGADSRQHMGRGSGIHAVTDLNANGQLEILFSYVEEVEIIDPSVQSYQYFPRRVIQLLEWNGTGFDYLPLSSGGEAPIACRAKAVAGGIDLLDRDEDGALELVLVSDIIIHPYSGPQRIRRETWDWRGDHLQFTLLDIGPPEFRFQAAQDGDDLVLLGQFEEALARYQDVIFDPDLLAWSSDRWWPDGFYQGLGCCGIYGTPGPMPTAHPDEQPRLQAYARYRMLVLHAARGDPYSARISYDELQQRVTAGPGLPYAELAAVFWEAYAEGNEIAAGCSAAVEFAQSHAEDILAPLGAGYYGWANRNYEPVDICPFGGPAYGR